MGVAGPMPCPFASQDYTLGMFYPRGPCPAVATMLQDVKVCGTARVEGCCWRHGPQRVRLVVASGRLTDFRLRLTWGLTDGVRWMRSGWRPVVGVMGLQASVFRLILPEDALTAIAVRGLVLGVGGRPPTPKAGERSG